MATTRLIHSLDSITALNCLYFAIRVIGTIIEPLIYLYLANLLVTIIQTRLSDETVRSRNRYMLNAR